MYPTIHGSLRGNLPAADSAGNEFRAAAGTPLAANNASTAFSVTNVCNTSISAPAAPAVSPRVTQRRIVLYDSQPSSPRSLQPAGRGNIDTDDCMIVDEAPAVATTARDGDTGHVERHSAGQTSHGGGADAAHSDDSYPFTSSDSKREAAARPDAFGYMTMRTFTEIAPAMPAGSAAIEDAHTPLLLNHAHVSVPQPQHLVDMIDVDTIIAGTSSGALPAATVLSANYSTSPEMYAPADPHHDARERLRMLFSDRMWHDVVAVINVNPGVTVLHVVCVLYCWANNAWQQCGGVLPLMQEASPSAHTRIVAPPHGGVVRGTVSLKGMQVEKSAASGERRRPVYCLQVVARLSDGAIIHGPRSAPFIRQCRPSYLTRVYLTAESTEPVLEESILAMLPNMRKRGRWTTAPVTSNSPSAPQRATSPAALVSGRAALGAAVVHMPAAVTMAAVAPVDSAIPAGSSLSVAAASAASPHLLMPVAAQLAAGAVESATRPADAHGLAALARPQAVITASHGGVLPFHTAAAAQTRPLFRTATRVVPHHARLDAAIRADSRLPLAPSYMRSAAAPASLSAFGHRDASGSDDLLDALAHAAGLVSPVVEAA